MTKRASVLLVAVIGGVLVGAVATTPALGAARRHTGTVMTVDPAADAFVVRELAEGGKPKTLSVRVGPDTRIILSERLADGEIKDPFYPYHDLKIDLADLRSGDYIVIESTQVRGVEIASEVIVTLREEPSDRSVGGLPPRRPTASD
jgi:hypothetical protein